jgi:hypothetical protein
MFLTARRAVTICAAVAATGLSVTAATVALASAGSAQAGRHHPPVYHIKVMLNGMNLSHTFIPQGSSTPTTEPLANPDDITRLGKHLFSGFQNGVGPQGQASSSGNLDSTIVEYSLSGKWIAQWDVTGKCDGLTADPLTHRLIATVNEDANSSIYVIRPFGRKAGQVTHFAYNEALPHFGGTDAIEIYHHMVLISASAPGTTGNPAPQASYPAVYRVKFDYATHVATVNPLFYDEDSATVANIGSGHPTVSLALTDPDSNEDVPASAQRFGGEFMLTSQGDQQQIFVRHAAKPDQSLSVLNLSASVDDTAWVISRHGALYADDTSGDTVDMVTGKFKPGTILVAVTPCDENSAPATCPAPGFPPNYLGQLDPWTGQIVAVPSTGATLEPQGMTFVPGHHGH